MPSTHSTPYGYDVGNHTYHQNRADASGNLLCGIAGTWADGMIEDTDQIVSKLTDISEHTNLCQSRLDNIQVDLAALEVLQTSTNTKLDTLETTNNAVETLITASNVDLAALEVLQTTTNTKLGTIETDIESQISLNNYIGSVANLMSSVSCVAAGQDSSVVDWGSTRCPKRVQITAVANSSTSGSGMEVYGSHDNSTWCVMTIGNSKTITLNTTESDGSAINSQCGIVTDWCMRYLKIRIYCLSTFTATAIGNI